MELLQWPLLLEEGGRGGQGKKSCGDDRDVPSVTPPGSFATGTFLRGKGRKGIRVGGANAVAFLLLLCILNESNERKSNNRQMGQCRVVREEEKEALHNRIGCKHDWREKGKEERRSKEGEEGEEG